MFKRRISDPPSLAISPSDHAGIRTLIAEYVTILILGHELAPEWKLFEEHVAKCTLCHHDVRVLQKLMRDAYSGQVPIRPFVPQPNLAFLRKVRPRPRSRTLRGHTIIATAYESVVRRFQFTAALLPLMQVPATVRGEELRLRYAYETMLDGDVALSIEIFSHADDSTTGVVRCCVEMSDRDPFDQAASKVILLASGKEFTSITGKDGTVSFVDVPLEDIENWQLIVTPPSKHLEADNKGHHAAG
jgi:hypothetical protein